MHADFYRLRGAEELTQLGWEETIEGAVTLVEWPERAASALPADRLDISFWFDPARGPDFRRAELRARGAMAGRFHRARAIEMLLGGAGWAEARRVPLHGDASIRAYERLTRETARRAILMISPPRPPGPALRFGKTYPEIARLSPDIRAFIAIDEGLSDLGFSTPRIFAYSVSDGLALLEDFGDETMAEGGAPNPSRYAEATALIARPARALPALGSARRRGDLHDPRLRHRCDADRSRARARLVCARDRARQSLLGRAHAVPGPLARGAGADPGAADDLDAA